MSALMNTYGARSTTLVRGEGPYVWDDQGRRYLDAISGIAVCGLGYSHPAVVDALCQQARTLIHCSNLYGIEPQQLLGKALTDISGMETVFFSNSGAEANEAAIKIARKYGNEKGIECPEIITTEQSFHGRTMATLTATGNEKVKTGFYPLVQGFAHVRYNSIEAIKSAATANTVAVMVEPIQGEGGINVPDANYLQQLRMLCDSNGWLLILDEIQTGNGRTGSYFAYQPLGIKPDVVTTAKGLGNGVPIGACLAAGPAAHILQPGNHGSTFGGNPLATNTALAVVNTINDPAIFNRVKELGEIIANGINTRLVNNPLFVEVRGKGLMLGVQLTQNCPELVDKAKEMGVLINVTAGNTIRLLPPFIMTNDDAHTIISTVCTLVENLSSQTSSSNT